VRPSLEYSSAVWDPHQQQDKQRLERIQRRAARYVTNRYHNTSSVSDMLDQFEWLSLESRRTNSRLTMMYKMTKNLTNVDTSDKLIPLIDHQEIVTPWHSAFHHAEHPYGRNHSIQEPPRIGML
jgi:hypothetical protein